MLVRRFLGVGLSCLLLVMGVAGQGLPPATAPVVPMDSVALKTVRGAMVTFGSLTQKSPVILVCFWSSNNEASVAELNAISASYEAWKQQANFTMMAICVDQGTLVNRMRPMANQNGWTFDVYADVSGDLQRALSFAETPQSMILNKGQVVYQQAGYSAGSEKYLFDKVKGLAGTAVKGKK